jgi:ATP-dependent DNA helicase RecQ
MNQEQIARREEAFQASRRVLKQYWGFDDFRDFQRGPVTDLASGSDVLAVLPTGGGKTICYQVPALVRGGLCLVVSPLIALMKDQIEGLRKRGIRCEAIISGEGDGDALRALDNASTGALQFLYISPERIQHPLFQARAPHLPIRTIAIDEAHCISQWGHDFRPAYRNIRTLRSFAPHAVWGAFTATATPPVFQDIAEQLGLHQASRHRSPMRRANLHYSVIHSGDPETLLLQTARESNGTGLVYVGTRVEAERWADRLAQTGLRAAAFHAGLPAGEKQRRQEQWIRGHLQVLACTSAFGMGIDKPDVRWVLHAHIPVDLESYVQEAGRAGRDGQPAECVLFASPTALQKASRRLERRFPSQALVRNVYQGIADAGFVAIGDCPEGETLFDSQQWSQRKGERWDEVKSALALLEAAKWISLRPLPSAGATLQFLATPEQVDAHILTHPPLAELLESLRRLPRVFIEPQEVNLKKWAERMQLPEEQIEEYLARWDRQGMINFHIQVPQWAIRWNEPRRAAATVVLPAEVYDKRKALLDEKWNDMQTYLGFTGCRSMFIDKYFGDMGDDSQPCEWCDVCLANRWNWEHWIDVNLPDQGITGAELLNQFPVTLRDHAIRHLRMWREEGRIYARGGMVFKA